MTVTIRLPTVLQRLANDQKEVTVEGDTVGAALQALGAAHPALGEQILDGPNVRPFVKVFIEGEEIADLDGEDTLLEGGESIRLVPAIAGGTCGCGVATR